MHIHINIHMACYLLSWMRHLFVCHSLYCCLGWKGPSHCGQCYLWTGCHERFKKPLNMSLRAGQNLYLGMRVGGNFEVLGSLHGNRVSISIIFTLPFSFFCFFSLRVRKVTNRNCGGWTTYVASSDKVFPGCVACSVSHGASQDGCHEALLKSLLRARTEIIM